MRFLTVEEVLEIHDTMLRTYKGLAGVRDMGLLLSALEMPKARMYGEYLHPTPFDMASAYLYYIVCNHPFSDGNKRTGAAAALIFLDMNVIEINLDDRQYEELVVEVAQGRILKDQISLFFEYGKTQ